MLDRKSQPSFVQNKFFKLLTPEIQILSNGSKIAFVHGGDQDIIKCEFVFAAGKWFESQPGISHFTANLLQKGTSKRTSVQISQSFDFYGAHLEVQSGFDFTTLTLYSHSKKFLFVIDLFIDIITNATFPENELQQTIGIYKQGLKINLEKTSFIASREFRKKLFGDAHPYGYDIDVTDVDNIRQQQLREFRNNHFGDFLIFISGRIEDRMKSVIVDKFNSLTVRKANPVNRILSSSNKYDFRLKKEGALQASIRIGKFTIGRSHPDYAGILLTNHIIGGFFGSRLMKNLREEKGLTYGIHSSVQGIKHDNFFSIGTDINRENVELAIHEIKHELMRLRTDRLSSSELNIARNHFIGSMQTEMNTPFAHADKIKMITLFNLPMKYYQQLIDELFVLDENQIMNFANKHFSENKLYTVVIGN